MATQPTRWGAFRDLDAAEEPEAVVEWLRRVANLPPVREGKRRSYQLLDAKPGDRVLDVGCGRGDDVLALSRLTIPQGQVVGIDSSSEAVDAARQAARQAGVNAQFHVADAIALPFADGSFDACRCDRTLQHLADPDAALREMVRIVRPGGVVLISESTHQVAADPDVDLSSLRQLLVLFHSEAERNGWIGFMLPLLVARVGLRETEVESVDGELTEAEAIGTWYDLPRLGQRAIAEGRLDAEELAAIQALVERETAAGRLRVVIETLLFVGRAPDLNALSKHPK